MSDSLKQTVVDVKVGDVVRHFSRDKVILVGSYLVEDSSYVKNLEIIINQENAESITTSVPYEGYGLGLVIEDFNADGKDEIMLRGAYGGSENLAIAAIYEYRDGKLAEIFNPWMFKEHYKLDAKYLEGYRVVVIAPQRGEKYIYDISQSPKIYLNMIYNELGEVVSDLKPTVGDVNGVFPIQVVTAKNPYLFIRQGIVGVGNADRIGYIESFVNLKDNNIKLIDSGAYVKGEKIEFVDALPIGAILIESKDMEGTDEKLLAYSVDGIPYLSVIQIKDGEYTIKDTFKGDGYTVKEILIKKQGDGYAILAGFELGGNIAQLETLYYKDGKLRKVGDQSPHYSKRYIRDLGGDDTEEVILWKQDTGEAYQIDIYEWQQNGLKKTDQYDKIYFPEVVAYYKALLENDKGSLIYQYYLALAYIKAGNYEKALQTANQARDKQNSIRTR